MDKIKELLNKKKNKKATSLQVRALTDTSYKNIEHSLKDDDTNFELATYGDAILKFALSKIYFSESTHEEGLSKWREKYESDEVLVKVIAKHYKLLKYLDFDKVGNGKPEEQMPQDYEHRGQSDNNRHKFIATAMEACLAAVYMENDENAVLALVENWIQWIDDAKKLATSQANIKNPRA